MAAAFNFDPPARTSSELIPRKDGSVFKKFTGFSTSSRRFRKIMLRAWFKVFVPRKLEDVCMVKDQGCRQIQSFLEKYGLHCYVRCVPGDKLLLPLLWTTIMS